MVHILNGHKLASGSLDKSIKIWDLKTGQMLKTLHVDRSWGIHSLALLHDKFVASISFDNTVDIWNLDSGEIAQTLTGQLDQSCLVSSKDSRYLVRSSENDKSIKIWT
jgi:WD40 repeat protein